MSDLANSCEYLTFDKTCSVVAENQKAKANRHMRCQNEEKMGCCYLCMSRRGCAVSCKFLGQTGVEGAPVETEKVDTDKTVTDEKEIELTQKDNSSVALCALCNVEMSQARTQFKIDGWKGQQPKLGGEAFSVIVYLCPVCGKIEFKAEQLNKN